MFFNSQRHKTPFVSVRLFQSTETIKSDALDSLEESCFRSTRHMVHRSLLSVRTAKLFKAPVNMDKVLIKKYC